MRKKLNHIKNLFFLILIILAIVSCRKGSDRKLILTVGHNLNEETPIHKSLIYMKKELAQLSNDTIELRIYPNSQLGSDIENLNMVQQGILSMTKASAAAVEGFVPEMSVFSLPYLFQDNEHYWRFLTSPKGEELLNAGVNKGFKGLCYYDAGSRSFYTSKKPILKPEDLRGVKIRVMSSQTAQNMVKTMGGMPETIPFGELYSALQQGVVDGAENNASSYYLDRHYEVCKYFSLDEHTRVPDLLLISSVLWEQISEERQEWILEAAGLAAFEEKRLWEEETQFYMNKLKEEGVQIYYPDKSLFASKTSAMRDNLRNEKEQQIIEEIQKLKE